MREMHAERRVLPPAVISRTLAVWDSDHTRLQEKTQVCIMHIFSLMGKLENSFLNHLSNY